MTVRKKLKVAILGTSPIMILIYLRFFKNYKIDVYENSHIGGAWRLDEIDKNSYTTHNNVIVPLKTSEERVINQINKELKKYNCKYYKPKGIYKLVAKYKPKNVYIHDLTNLISYFRKNCKKIISKKIKVVKIDDKKILINNKKYDYALFPSCFDVKKIIISGNYLDINPEKSTSHHLTVCLKNFKFPRIDYSENFDNVFDRGYFKKNKDKVFFTGRVRKEFKKLTNSDLLKKSNTLKLVTKHISHTKLNRYHHYIVNNDKLSEIRLKTKKTNFKLIETRQFTHAYSLLNKKKLEIL